MSWGTYYLIRHPSKKEDPIHGQRQEHVHFKIWLEGQRALTSYVLPQKKFEFGKRTFLVYMGKFEANSAITSGQIIEKGVLDKLGPGKYSIGDKFIINIFQPKKMAKEKSKIFFVSYEKLGRPEKWWIKYKEHLKEL